MHKVRLKLVKNNKNLTFVVLAAIVAYLLNTTNFAGWILVAGTLIAVIAPMRHIIELLRIGHFPSTLLLPFISVTALLIQEFWMALSLIGITSILQLLERQVLKPRMVTVSKKAAMYSVLKGKKAIDVKMSAITPGMILVIDPGEMIPVDAEIITGETKIQDSILTGEPTLVNKPEGSRVYAGSINAGDTITIKALQPSNKSQTALTEKLLHNCYETKSELVSSTTILAIILMVISIIAAGVVYQLQGSATNSLIIMTMLSPFSVLLGAKLSLRAGVSSAAKNGVYFRSFNALENAATIRSIFMNLDTVLSPNDYKVASFTAKSEEKQRVAGIIRALASNTKSPRLQAVCGYTAKSPIAKDIKNMKNPDDELITAQSKDGPVSLGVGSVLMDRGYTEGLDDDKVYLMLNKQIIGICSLEVYPDSNAQIALQQLMTRLKKSVIAMTGLSERLAKQAAARLHIENVYSQSTTAEQIQIIEHSTHKPTLYITNDATDASMKAATMSACLYRNGLSVDLPKADIAILGSRILMVPYMLKAAQKSVTNLLVLTASSLAIIMITTILAVLFLSNPLYSLLAFLLQTLALTLIQFTVVAKN